MLNLGDVSNGITLIDQGMLCGTDNQATVLCPDGAEPLAERVDDGGDGFARLDG